MGYSFPKIPNIGMQEL